MYLCHNQELKSIQFGTDGENVADASVFRYSYKLLGNGVCDKQMLPTTKRTIQLQPLHMVLAKVWSY